MHTSFHHLYVKASPAQRQQLRESILLPTALDSEWTNTVRWAVFQRDGELLARMVKMADAPVVDTSRIFSQVVAAQHFDVLATALSQGGVELKELHKSMLAVVFSINATFLPSLFTYPFIEKDTYVNTLMDCVVLHANTPKAFAKLFPQIPLEILSTTDFDTAKEIVGNLKSKVDELDAVTPAVHMHIIKGTKMIRQAMETASLHTLIKWQAKKKGGQ